MNENIKHLVLGVCVASVLLGAFVGAVSAATWYVEEGESIQAAVDEAAMPFYSDTISPHHIPFDLLIDEDEEYLAHETHFSLYKHSIPKHELIRALGIRKSNNYTFSLHGKVQLLWSYVNDERDARVDFDILDDVNGDGIVDVLASDCDSESKLFVISGKDGSTIWSKNYPAGTWMHINELDDANGDGIDEAIVYWGEYDRSSNQTNITIELLSGSNGDKIWSEKISYEGRYHARVHGIEGDLTGDEIEDILIEAECWELGVTVLHALNSKDGSKLWERRLNGRICGCYEWDDLTDDGITDFVVSSSNRDDNTGKLSVINGSDGSVEWYKSFVGDTNCPNSRYDFDGDGLNDIQIVNNDANNKTGEVYVFKGTDGSVIWSKSFNRGTWMFGLSDFNGDGIEERCLRLMNFTNYRVVEVQVLSGREGSLIWKRDVKVSNVGYSKDLNGDGKSDILLSNCTKIAENECLYDVNAISGVDGSEIWEKTFSHDIEIEIPESEHWREWSYLYGYHDLSGDGIADPLLEIECRCGYWDEDTSTVCEYSANKLILINGKDGAEIWDAECTVDEGNVWLSRRSGIDFNNDGIKDVLLRTGKGVYLLTVSETPINQPPVAYFTYEPKKTAINEKVIFNASSSYDSDGYITSCEWKFGDGDVGEGKVITHAYSSKGNYTVSLTVTDNDRATDSTTKVISVRRVPKVIYVPDNFSSIQAAVDVACVRDTIVVRDGTYAENVDVYKSLTIRSTSENPADTIVQAKNSNDHVFEVTADYVNISGFTVGGATEWPNAGIDLNSAEYCNISNNNCANNTFSICLDDSNNNKLTGNTMLKNGIVIWGGSVSDYTHEIDTSNTVNGKPVYYWKDVEGGRIPDGAGQVILVNCKDVVVENQNLNDASIGIRVAFSSFITIKDNNCYSNNRLGVDLFNSNNNSISNNNCSNNWVGIDLWDSHNNSISNNNCSNNYKGIICYRSDDNSLSNNNCSNNNIFGVQLLMNSNNNNISNNICSNNERGIYPMNSYDNVIYLNNFMNNTYNVYSYESTNIWNSPEPINYKYKGNSYTNYLGNYWSDYEEKYPDVEEIDGTGIRDTPYGIDGDKDNYPLVERFENYFEGEEEEHSALIKCISRETDFYDTCYEYTFNATWWGTKAVTEMDSVWNILVIKSAESGTQTALILADLGKISEVASKLGNKFFTSVSFIFNVAEIIKKTLESVGYSQIGASIAEAHSESIRFNLYDLIENGNNLMAALSKNDESRIESLLEERAYLIKDIYADLSAFDEDANFYLKNPSAGPAFFPGWKYGMIHENVGALRCQLQLDYLVTISELNNLTGESYNLFLHEEVPEGKITPKRLDNTPLKAWCFGCLDYEGDTDNFTVKIPGSSLPLFLEIGTGYNLTFELKGNGEVIKENKFLETQISEGTYNLTVICNGCPQAYNFYAISGVKYVYAIASDIQPAEEPYQEYPAPDLYWFSTDKDNITLEDEVTVEVIFKNEGGESAWQSIAISSPDVNNTESYTILDSNLDYCEKYDIGYDTGYNYGNTTKPLKYPLIEGAKNDWVKGFNGELKLKIKPEKEGILRIYAKSVAYGSGVWRSAPKIFETSTKDQQNEYVYVKSIVVTNEEQGKIEIVINCPVTI